jgi:hypothetical protein
MSLLLFVSYLKSLNLDPVSVSDPDPVSDPNQVFMTKRYVKNPVLRIRDPVPFAPGSVAFRPLDPG